MCLTIIRRQNIFNICIRKKNVYLNFFEKILKIDICENTASLIFDFAPRMSRGVMHLQYKVCFVLTVIFLIGQFLKKLNFLFKFKNKILSYLK